MARAARARLERPGPTRAVVTGRVVAVAGSTPGATMRITWPGSIRFGLTKLFQRIRSFQFWPLSRPIRISVSPGLIV
jgi:hypothetical protein